MMMKKNGGSVFAFLVCVTAPALAQQLPPYKSGFPLSLAGQGQVQGKPALADLRIPGDTVGVKSIVFVGVNGNLHVIHRTSGGTWTQAAGFPVAVGGPVLASPAIGDLDSPPDGIPEIVVAYGNFAAAVPGGVKAFRNNGALMWSRPSRDVIPGGGPDPVVSTPAIGDVDNDGANDVVWGSTDQYIYFVNGNNGTDKTNLNWPRQVSDSVISSPALHDMDGDGRLEIIIGVDAQDNPFLGTSRGGCLHVLPASQPPLGVGFPADYGFPQDRPGFPKCVNQVIYSDPVVGDIDGDGRPEIVHGTGNFYAGMTKAIYAWECDGTAVAGWPFSVPGETLYGVAPALANLDGDAALEVVVTVDQLPTTRDGRVYAINGNGTVMPGFPKAPLNFFGTSPPLNIGTPLVADVLGTTTAPEILVTTNSEITVFDTAGNQLTENGPPQGAVPSFYTSTALEAIAVGDLDPGDNRIEVVAISAGPFASPVNTEIHVWNPVTRATASLWGQYLHNERRTAVAPSTPACRTYGTCAAPPAAPNFFTVAPCRMVDTRNAAGPFGGPALASGGLRDFVLRGLCGIPAGAKALSLNVTVVSPTGAGFVRFSPSCQMPLSSTINFSTGQTRANNATLLLGNSDGILTANASVLGNGTVHLLVDVNGYFQ
jgi:hypothetical protein